MPDAVPCSGSRPRATTIRFSIACRSAARAARYRKAGLVYAGDELFYGTTAFGGASGCAGKGCGTVFALVPFGTNSTYYIYHRLAGRSDAKEPEALAYGKGALYGTTWAGGGSGCGGSGCGTLFSIALNSGQESYVARLARQLYGTTYYGGGASACSTRYEGCGTIFEIDPKGSGYGVLYRFQALTTAHIRRR